MAPIDHGADAGRGGEPEAVDDAADRNLIVEQGLVEIGQREVGERQAIDPAAAEGGDRPAQPTGATALRNTTRHAERKQQPFPAAELDGLQSQPAPADRHVRAALQIAALKDQSERRSAAPAVSDSAEASAQRGG